MYQRYKDRIDFRAVYVREAHPADGWSSGKDPLTRDILQPKTAVERVNVATKCCATLHVTMPMVVDDLNDSVGHAYSGMPDRLYLIGRDGRVAYKGGRGPFGFKPGELEQALVMLLLEQDARAKESANVPLLDNATAWKHLPRAERGADAPLPVWARATAEALPRTTAAMLELDYLHRVASPLPARLRGMMRWAAADVNRCDYTRTQSLADLRRAGVPDDVLNDLTKNPARLPADERDAIAFARKLTGAAFTVTDDEMADLVKTHGAKQVVAMVQLLAFSNFQDRLLHALGVASQRPLPPLDVKFAKPADGSTLKAPPRTLPNAPTGQAPAGRITDAEWLAFDYDALQKRLAKQRARSPRVPVPTWEEYLKANPGGPPRAPGRKLAIKWSLVCGGYQPELARGWGACTGGFRVDAKQDRAFEELLFWVVTRSLNCFY